MTGVKSFLIMVRHHQFFVTIELEHGSSISNVANELKIYLDSKRGYGYGELMYSNSDPDCRMRDRDIAALSLASLRKKSLIISEGDDDSTRDAAINSFLIQLNAEKERQKKG